MIMIKEEAIKFQHSQRGQGRQGKTGHLYLKNRKGPMDMFDVAPKTKLNID